MVTHAQARRLLATLVENLDYDPETFSRMLDYIDSQERGPAADAHLSDREHSIRAANRAVEAISRCGALADDMAGQGARIASLEALCGDLAEALETLLGTL